ncbi:helix-turn-helix domain-containing protein [Amycolatopsis sp. NPDC058986]|uniref:helix-turn-helix domain-containing protein n=1 Tax=unclassified Amycolatopsis TaxID=2618356 RepID=UPI0036734506
MHPDDDSSENAFPSKRTRAPQVFEELPSGLGALILPELPSLADEIVRRVRETIPEYGMALDGPYAQKIRLGVEHALRQFADQIIDPRLPQDERAEVYRALGRVEAREGRSLDSLQSALRTGMRVAWKRIIDFGQRAGLPQRTIWLLGDAALAHMDLLAGLAVDGYTQIQTRTAGNIERARGRLLDMLVGDASISHDTLLTLAQQARWSIPQKICGVALSRIVDSGARPSAHWPGSYLVDLERDVPCLLVPNPRGRSWWNDAARSLAGWHAMIGPTVPLADAAKSLRLAVEVSTIVTDDHLKMTPATWCVDHLLTAWLMRDSFLATQLIETRLAPLRDLTSKQHVRLRTTLLAWLQTGGSLTHVGAELAVHPQTVRYRMRQVENLFNDQLSDPIARLELELALRAFDIYQRAGSREPTSN